LGIASAKGVQYLTEVTQKGQVLCKWEKSATDKLWFFLVKFILVK
jgi:hypothetical protein